MEAYTVKGIRNILKKVGTLQNITEDGGYRYVFFVKNGQVLATKTETSGIILTRVINVSMDFPALIKWFELHKN